MSRQIIKCAMSELSPKVLLSSVSRDRCISSLKALPLAHDPTAAVKRTAAVLVPICVVDDEVSLLYTLRSADLKAHSGQVSFPGGKTDDRETRIETALRETEEELGIQCDNIEIWSEMPALCGRDETLLITPVVGYIPDFSMSKLTPNRDEVDTVFTVSLKNLIEPKNHGHYVSRFNSLEIPVFIFGEYKIWGITGFMTYMFLNCLLPNGLSHSSFGAKSYKFKELMPKPKL